MVALSLAESEDALPWPPPHTLQKKLKKLDLGTSSKKKKNPRHVENTAFLVTDAQNQNSVTGFVGNPYHLKQPEITPQPPLKNRK